MAGIPMRVAAAGTLAVLALTGCGADKQPVAGGSAPNTPSGAITVLAAASLTEAFTAEAAAFERRHPAVRVRLSFAGSASLVRQVIEGAPADVFAPADQTSMQKAVAAKATRGEPQIFARNSLVIAVAKGNPHRIASLADLARADLIVVLCAQSVPCGRFGAQALAKAGVTVHPASREESVKGVATKIAIGEADAGLVYRTDVLAAKGNLAAIPIPERHNVDVAYPIVMLNESRNRSTAQSFIDFIRSPDGLAIMARFGFGAP